jgi:hypothetical protein
MLSRQIKGKRDAIPLHITYLHTITRNGIQDAQIVQVLVNDDLDSDSHRL